MMSKNKLIVLHGAGRLSEMIYNIVKNDYEEFYLYVDHDFLGLSQSDSTISVISSLPEGISADYISTIGYKNMARRKSAYIAMSSKEALSSVNILHPAAYISSAAQIGVGNIFSPGVVIEDGTTVIIISFGLILASVMMQLLVIIIFIAASVTVGGYCVVGGMLFRFWKYCE